MTRKILIAALLATSLSAPVQAKPAASTWWCNPSGEYNLTPLRRLLFTVC